MQWEEKAAYAWEAVKRSASLRETAQRLRRAFPDGVDSPTDYDVDAVEAFQKQMYSKRALHAG